MIAGSPKKKKSTSEIVLNSLSERLTAATIDWIFAADFSEENEEELFEKMLENDIIVFSFPLYIDSIPSHLIRFMEAMENRYRDHIMNTKVYCIVNCGFHEPENAEIAIEMIKLWTSYSGLIFAQAAALGGGGMGRAVPIGEGILSSYGEVLDELADNIYADIGGETLFTSLDMSKADYIADAHKAWKIAAKKRGVSSWAMRKKL